MTTGNTPSYPSYPLTPSTPSLSPPLPLRHPFPLSRPPPSTMYVSDCYIVLLIIIGGLFAVVLPVSRLSKVVLVVLNLDSDPFFSIIWSLLFAILLYSTISTCKCINGFYLSDTMIFVV